MTKADLIKTVAKKAYLSKSQAEAALNVLFQEMKNELKKRNGKVVIDEVVTLTNVVRPKMKRHDIKTKKMKTIKAGRRIKLAVSPKLKKQLK